jgi:hypothetical protein
MLVSPTNVCNVPRLQHKVVGAENDVIFHHHFCWYFTAYFWQQLLHLAPYFVHFFQMMLSSKALKIFCAKAL